MEFRVVIFFLGTLKFVYEAVFYEEKPFQSALKIIVIISLELLRKQLHSKTKYTYT
jgi:hypothetical protein